ncbi:lipoyl amidotransferase LIPT1, mitochondrial-like [Styela clava]|uniref:lipoyltransferase 1, mitochondrial-like n=1 Tax=Styela clava TaxID=7725 RepID=UPI00193975FD|nr:lipoyltransferase 1, mitochondrial-like [Styela clava]
MRFHFRNLQNLVRHYSKHIVYRTETNNPYHNLAFEEWMYENVDLSSTSCLFIWRSLPSVVIGRHQNPWAECNVRSLMEKDVCIVRRQSGGGTVYHDLGNINITFFTARSLYDRRANLNIIVSALNRKWKNLDLSVNCRDDIILDKKYKISGSAAKLGRNNAYHHCTLLFDANLSNMEEFLKSSIPDVSTKATRSVPSETKNLSNYVPGISYEDICDAVTSEYFTYSSDSDQNIVAHVDPTNQAMFPNSTVIVSKLKSWEWVFGKSSKFTTKWSYDTPEFGNMVVQLSVSNGIINDVQWMFRTDFLNELNELGSMLIGKKFRCDVISFTWVEFMLLKRHSLDSKFIGSLGDLISDVVKYI